ncbi:hypothetical protein AB0G85_05870 [Streptomyces sioyaensis]|uniref:hypothetical protein n=1 Tax=Streptomyces sioyaensis TaxID=67364 RepID=UPI0033FD72D3
MGVHRRVPEVRYRGRDVPGLERLEGHRGQAVEYLGEWDYPLNKVLHKALDLYMSRR